MVFSVLEEKVRTIKYFPKNITDSQCVSKYKYLHYMETHEFADYNYKN